jgi:colicin import membrane protein
MRMKPLSKMMLSILMTLLVPAGGAIAKEFDPTSVMQFADTLSENPVSQLAGQDPAETINTGIGSTALDDQTSGTASGKKTKKSKTKKTSKKSKKKTTTKKSGKKKSSKKKSSKKKPAASEESGADTTL